MPTKRPRIAVTLSPSAAEALRELGSLTRQSQSRIVSDLLSMSEPVFRRMAKVMRLAELARTGAGKTIAADLGRVQARLERQLDQMSEELFLLPDDEADVVGNIVRVVKERRDGARGARAGGRPGARPPLSNRGVVPPKKGERTGAGSRRRAHAR
jgi:hypothetical protein